MKRRLGAQSRIRVHPPGLIATLALVALCARAAAGAEPAPVDSGPSPALSDSLRPPARADSVPSPAPADSLRSAAPRRPGVADTVTVLPPVHVRDRRSQLPERSTATSIRLERSGVVRFLPGTVGDALAAVPGVDQVKLGPWANKLSMRGLSGDRVLVLVDGVRLNTARGHGGQSSLVSVDRLDAVELLPGATSAQFGSDALGGVVNLITHRSLFAERPTTDWTLTVRGSTPGEGAAQQLRARVRTPRWGAELAGGLGSLDALTTPAGRLPNSAYREDNWTARGAVALGSVVLDYEHARQAAHQVGP